MTTPWEKVITRRGFMGGAATLGLGAAAAACAPPGAAPTGGKPKLRILQWSHFVPVFDEWYDPWVLDWGKKNGVDVTVDHMPHLEMPARLAAEVAAKAGHDLIQMTGTVLTYRYADQMADLSDVVDHAVKKNGQMEPIGQSLGKVGGKWVGVPNYSIWIGPIIRKDLFQQAGFDWQKVTTWDDYLAVGRKLSKADHPAGLAISHCNDANHNWRALMWCFGASEVAEDGKTVTVDSPEMREFLRYSKAFYEEANTPEVFAWDDAADNRHLGSGVGGYIHDALSSMRSVEDKNPQLYAQLQTMPVVAGPKAQIAMTDVVVYSIWNFAPKESQDAAKAFLKYYFDNYKEAYLKSTGYNMPQYANLWQKPMPILSAPNFAPLQDYRGKLVDNFGHPGPPTAEATVTLQQFIIPDMVGIAVRPTQFGIAAKDSISEAIKWGKDQLKKIYK